jgi:hypothetical protein
VVRASHPADDATLLSLFTLVTLFAHQRMVLGSEALRQAAGYRKPYPTFSNALALVR